MKRDSSDVIVYLDGSAFVQQNDQIFVHSCVLQTVAQAECRILKKRELHNSLLICFTWRQLCPGPPSYQSGVPSRRSTRGIFFGMVGQRVPRCPSLVKRTWMSEINKLEKTKVYFNRKKKSKTERIIVSKRLRLLTWLSIREFVPGSLLQA